MTPEPAAPAPDPPRSAVHVRAAQIVLIEDPQGLGTGILVGPDGLVLTNKHVAPSLGPYRVILADGKDVRGVGVHQDPHHDLAVVKIAASPASFLDVGTDVADEYVVGEEVFALGHPRGCRFSVARGIISNPHREFEKEYYVQTDVSINPGNSGGPLVDRQGRLIGVVTMILSNSQGLGFAVPGHIAADYVRHVRRLLRANVVRIPEELFAHPDPPRDDAREVVRRAIGALVAAGRTSIKDEKPDLGTHTLEHKSATVEVAVQEGMFTVRAQLSALGPGERQNAPFLCRLLELSSSQDVGGASFTLRDGALQAVVARRAASLDLEEATWAIDLIAHTAAAAPAKVASLLFGSAQPTPAGAALAAAPPAPPVAPAPPAPPPGAPQAPWPPPPYAAPPPSPAAPNPLGPAVFGPPAYGQPPPPQPPYGAPPGYAPPGYGYGAPPMPPPPGYGAPPMPPPPGYGAPPGAPPPAYGAPPGLPPAPGYGAPPGAPPAYGAPPMPPAPGYGAPPPAAPPAPPADPGYPIIQPPPPAGWK